MTRKRKHDLFHHLWAHESGLSVMLLLLFIMQFIFTPLFGSHNLYMVILNIFWVLILLSGIFAVANNNQQAYMMAIVPILSCLFGWINAFNPNPFFAISDFILTVISILLLIVLVFIKVFEPGPVTIHRIVGSIVVYMMMANVWSITYLFIYQNIEGAFQLTLPPFESNSLEANFQYFSYITITTTGYGEIVPLHPIARSLVEIEAIFGVLYPVILIGRLVSDANAIKPIKHP